MKDANQLAEEIMNAEIHSFDYFENLIRIIQLDAWKQGMNDAAEIAAKHEADLDISAWIEDKILKARDNKTTI